MQERHALWQQAKQSRQRSLRDSCAFLLHHALRPLLGLPEDSQLSKGAASLAAPFLVAKLDFPLAPSIDRPSSGSFSATLSSSSLSADHKHGDFGSTSASTSGNISSGASLVERERKDVRAIPPSLMAWTKFDSFGHGIFREPEALSWRAARANGSANLHDCLKEVVTPHV